MTPPIPHRRTDQMGVKQSIAILILALASCGGLSSLSEQQAIQTAKNQWLKGGMDERLVSASTFKAFSTKAGWTVIMTPLECEWTTLMMDQYGMPRGQKAPLSFQPTTGIISNKYMAASRAVSLRKANGETNEVPCYAVPTGNGWMAIFGGYGNTFTILMDKHGVVYDATWIE